MALVKQAELAEWLGYDPNSTKAIADALRAQNIPFMHGRAGQLATTEDAITRALVGENDEDSNEKVEF